MALPLRQVRLLRSLFARPSARSKQTTACSGRTPKPFQAPTLQAFLLPSFHWWLLTLGSHRLI